MAKDRSDKATITTLSLKQLKLHETKRRLEDALDVCRAALEWAKDEKPLLQAQVKLTEPAGDPMQIADALEALLRAERGSKAAKLGRRLASPREEPGEEGAPQR